MPILPSAKKRLRRDRRVTRLNLAAKEKVKAIIKTIRDFVKQGKIEEAKKEYPKAQKLIDKAAKKHLFHKNKAARKKSQLAKLIAGSQKPQSKTTASK